MSDEGSETRPAFRVRRARREDIRFLEAHVGGPPAGRIRALRRLLKTLSADTYVLDRKGTLDGIVAISYQRSFSLGGLIANVDAIESLRSGQAERLADLELLTECATQRAKRRGCVAIHMSVTNPDAREVLLNQGFAAGEPRLERTLRSEGTEQ